MGVPTVGGMDVLDERPVWSMSGSEMLTALDALQAELTRIQVRRLELLAGLDANGHAKDIGARDTVQLVSVRFATASIPSTCAEISAWRPP